MPRGKINETFKEIVFVPAVALAFGLVSCGDNTYNANDTISSPEVFVVADPSGVNLIKVNPAKDVASTAIYRKVEGEQSWADASTADTQWWFEADKTIQYKVIATPNSAQGNLKSAETVKNVKLPKEFTAITTLAAKDVKVSLKPETVNKVLVEFSANPAADYVVYASNDKSLGAEGIAVSNNKKDDVDGLAIAHVKGDKILASTARVEFDLTTTKAEEEYFVVIEETAKSVIKPSKTLVLADASVKVKPASVTVSAPAVARLDDKTAKVTFTVDAIDGKAPEATYEVYKAVKTDGVYGGYAKVDGNVVYENIDKVSTAKVEKINIYVKDTVPSVNNKDKVEEIKYIVVTTFNGEKAYTATGSEAKLNVTKASNATATEEDVSGALTATLNASQKINVDTDKGTSTPTETVNLSTTVVEDSTVALVYGKFATLAAAEKATLADLTTTLTMTAGTKVTTGVTTTTEDGVVTEQPVTKVPYEATLKLEAGITKTNKTNVDKDGNYSYNNTVSNTGAFYVFRLVVTKDGKEAVSNKTVYTTVTTNTTYDKRTDKTTTSETIGMDIN